MNVNISSFTGRTFFFIYKSIVMYGYILNVS